MGPPAAPGRGTISLDFLTRVDGRLFHIGGDDRRHLALTVASGRLLYSVHTATRSSLLDLEDSAPLTDGTWHSVAVTVDERGTRIHLDGYQAFAGTTTAFLADIDEHPSIATGDQGQPEVRAFDIQPEPLSSRHIMMLAANPTPIISFAAGELSDYDVESVGGLRQGSIGARFRVRGRGQGGIILAASGAGREQLRIRLDHDGIAYEVTGRGERWRYFRASGHWDDGHWHDLVIRSGLGAIEIYVDGYRELHAPGEAFFADIEAIDRVVVGQDTSGARLFGEVQRAAIYSNALGDSQIKQLAGAEPVETVALFDRGYLGSVSYRIPALLTTAAGTVIAGADQRTSMPNDVPNHINFVIRRSADGGETWQPTQVVLDSPGEGLEGASATDPCLVQDEQTGRIIVLLDHFPGGVGQPNSAQGIGVDEHGRYILRDRAGDHHTLLDTGGVITADGGPTDYHIDRDGNVTRSGIEPPDGDNIHLAWSIEFHETLRTERTCFLQMVWSDDDGITWHGPRNLNHLVKEPWMAFLGACPGTGIQLRHGAFAGRLVVPVYYNDDNARRFYAAVVYSDDHGDTWTRGASPNATNRADSESRDTHQGLDDEVSLYESSVVERRDGSLLMFLRNQHPSGRIAVTHSQDGGQTWGSVRHHEQIPEIFCQPNAISYPSDDTQDRVVFANASELLPYRGAGVLRLSEDGGDTWVASRLLNPGHHAYQSMTILPDGRIGVLWENEWQGLYLTRLSLTWLEGSSSSDPAAE